MDGNGEGCHPLIINTLTSTLGVAVLNDHIYAVGGFDGSCGLNTAEVMVDLGAKKMKIIIKRRIQLETNSTHVLQPFKGVGHVGRWNPRVEKHREYEHKAQQCWGWSSPGGNCTKAFGHYILWNFSIVQKDSETPHS